MNCSCRFFGVNTSAQQEAFKFKELIFKFLSVAGTIKIGDYIPWLKWVTTVTGFKRYMKKVKADVDNMLQEFLDFKKNGKSMNAAPQAAADSKSPEQHRDDFVDILLRQPTEDGTGRLSDTTIKALIQVQHTHPHFKHAAPGSPELPKACWQYSQFFCNSRTLIRSAPRAILSAGSTRGDETIEVL